MKRYRQVAETLNRPKMTLMFTDDLQGRVLAFDGLAAALYAENPLTSRVTMLACPQGPGAPWPHREHNNYPQFNANPLF